MAPPRPAHRPSKNPGTPPARRRAHRFVSGSSPPGRVGRDARMAMTGGPGLLGQRIHPHPLRGPRATEASWGGVKPRVGPRSMPSRLPIGPQKPGAIDEGRGAHRAMAADRLPIAHKSREVRDTRGATLHPHPRIRARRAAGNERLFLVTSRSVTTGGPAPGRSGHRAGRTARPPTPSRGVPAPRHPASHPQAASHECGRPSVAVGMH